MRLIPLYISYIFFLKNSKIIKLTFLFLRLLACFAKIVNRNFMFALLFFENHLN